MPKTIWVELTVTEAKSMILPNRMRHHDTRASKKIREAIEDPPSSEPIFRLGKVREELHRVKDEVELWKTRAEKRGFREHHDDFD